MVSLPFDKDIKKEDIEKEANAMASNYGDELGYESYIKMVKQGGGVSVNIVEQTSQLSQKLK